MEVINVMIETYVMPMDSKRMSKISLV